jgi:hypothetical protein
MGGFGSGRYGGRPTVESAVRLDIDDMMEWGGIRAFVRLAGEMRFNFYGDQIAMKFESRVGERPRDHRYGFRIPLRGRHRAGKPDDAASADAKSNQAVAAQRVYVDPKCALGRGPAAISSAAKSAHEEEELRRQEELQRTEAPTGSRGGEGGGASPTGSRKQAFLEPIPCNAPRSGFRSSDLRS